MIARVVSESGHELTSPWVLGAIEKDRPAQVDVFKRDKSGAEACDILVADVSEPSIGVGMEIMAAHQAGKRIILVVRRGNITSRMLMHMQPKEVIEYENERTLVDGLERALRGPVNLK